MRLSFNMFQLDTAQWGVWTNRLWGTCAHVCQASRTDSRMTVRRCFEYQDNSSGQMKFIQRKLDAQLRSKWEEINICCYSFCECSCETLVWCWTLLRCRCKNASICCSGCWEPKVKTIWSNHLWWQLLSLQLYQSALTCSQMIPPDLCRPPAPVKCPSCHALKLKHTTLS